MTVAPWRRFFLVGALVALEFLLVYAGANYLTSLHGVRLHLYHDAELAIPFVPFMLVPYIGMFLIFPLAPLILRDTLQVDALARALAWVIAIAGVGFLSLPATLGFAPVAAHRWAPLLDFADRMNLDFNLLPSLHVALFVTCAGTYARQVGKGARRLLASWTVLVCASTVLTHQHHVADALLGFLLGLWGTRLAIAPPARRSAVAAIGSAP